MTEKEFLLLYKERKKLKTLNEAKEKFNTFLDSLDIALDKDGELILDDWIIIRKRRIILNFKVKNILKRKNIKYRKRVFVK